MADLYWSPAYSHGGRLTEVPANVHVVHSVECDIVPGICRSLMGVSWFGGPKAGTSIHDAFDPTTGTAGVHYDTVAYHVMSPGNEHFTGTEHAGRAAMTAAQWRTPAALAMVKASAEHTARRFAGEGIPWRWLSVPQIRTAVTTGRPQDGGLCTHNDVRLAFPGTTTHTDPGVNFPYAEYLAYGKAFLAGAGVITPEGDDDMPLSADDIEKVAQRTRQVIATAQLPYGLDALRARIAEVKASIADVNSIAKEAADRTGSGAVWRDEKGSVWVTLAGSRYHVPDATELAAVWRIDVLNVPELPDTHPLNTLPVWPEAAK